jgi:hypothetical protein
MEPELVSILPSITDGTVVPEAPEDTKILPAMLSALEVSIPAVVMLEAASSETEPELPCAEPLVM